MTAPRRKTPEIYAALDLGSNSFHLQIAEVDQGQLRTLDRHKEMVRFAAGLDDNNYLSADAQQRALDCLRKMADRLRGIPRDHIRVVGTNTLRMATNAAEFLGQAEAVLGVPIDIISGTEEARLIYLGVASDFSPEHKRRLVIDIGGGSTELVVGNGHPELMESLGMGCVSFSRRFFGDGSISETAFRKALKAARQEISPYVETYSGQWQEAVGASGTLRSIGVMHTRNGLSAHDAITPKGLKVLAEKMLTAKHVDGLKIDGLAEERKSVFPGGLAIVTALVSELEIPRLLVSGYAIREGIIHDLAGRLHHHDTRDETIRHLMRQYKVDAAQSARVAALAERWLPAVKKYLLTEPAEARNLLRWAASLHEIGLAIAHGGYHKHAAYILSNADMPGFSRQEQARLSFLVLNHRRKPKDVPDVYGLQPDWLLVALFRLACIFCRRRQPTPIPKTITLRAGKKSLEVHMSRRWYDTNPLIAADLEDERELIGAQGIELKIATT